MARILKYFGIFLIVASVVGAVMTISSVNTVTTENIPTSDAEAAGQAIGAGIFSFGALCVIVIAFFFGLVSYFVGNSGIQMDKQMKMMEEGGK